MALLEVNDLRTHFRTDDGTVKAVDGVSFQVEKGKTLGIVGESGSGKSVTCLTIMGLNARTNTMSSGQALWKGNDLLKMNSRQLRSIRGDAVSRSSPFQSALPEDIALRFGLRPMIVRQVTLLPEPDSPTMPRVCPLSTANETPSTARTTPSSVLKYVFRSLTSRRAKVR